MKSCQEFIPRLGAYADGELPEDDRGPVAEHLGWCVACAERLRVLAAQGAALREKGVREAAGRDLSGVADAVMARVAQEHRPLLQRAGPWGAELWAAHRSALAAAGSLALAACLGLAVFLRPAPPDPLLLQAQIAAVDAASPQVDEVEFGSHDGMVMQLRDRTPVIWLGEEHAQ